MVARRTWVTIGFSARLRGQGKGPEELYEILFDAVDLCSDVL